jgi:hypothetical protein
MSTTLNTFCLVKFSPNEWTARKRPFCKTEELINNDNILLTNSYTN